MRKEVAASKLGQTGNDHEEQDNQRVKKNSNMVFMVVTKKSKEIKKLCTLKKGGYFRPFENCLNTCFYTKPCLFH